MKLSAMFVAFIMLVKAILHRLLQNCQSKTRHLTTNGALY